MYINYNRKRRTPVRLYHKLLLVMRLTAVILIASLMQVSAAGLAQKISLSKSHAPLKAVLKEIRTQSGYVFLYSEEQIRNARPISIKVKNADFQEVLQQIFANQPLSYSINEKTITIKEKESSFLDKVAAAFTNSDVRGMVTDVLGNPLPGASVKIKGTNIVVVTNSDGAFRLEHTDKNVVLIISYVGYKTREFNAMATESPLTIVLQDDENKLSEVVINTGYQTLSKERSAGAFSKPEMKVFSQRSGTMNILQRLDGLVPGLNLNNGLTNGFYSVNIRGLSTIYGASEPLYVVDGVAVANLNIINPNDVADVTVLKDATASSIWGARAANGVIVITTKRGSGNQNQLNIDYDMFYSFQGKPDINVFPTMNSQQYLQTMEELYKMPGYVRNGATDWASINTPNSTTGRSQVLPHEYLLYGKSTLAPDYYKNKSIDQLAAFDNAQQMKDLWYRNAVLSNQTLSLSGTSGKYGAYASVSYTGQQDFTPGNRNNLYQFNARQDYTFNTHIQAYLITNLSYQNLASKRTIAPNNKFVPYAAFNDENGSSLDHSWLFWSRAVRDTYEQKSLGLPDLGQLNLGYNPASNFDSGSDQGTVLNSRILAGITAKVLNGLRFEGVYGTDLQNNQSKKYNAVSGFDGQVELAKMTITTPSLKSYVPTTGGILEKTNIQQRNWTVRNQLAFDRNWDEGVHQLNILAGLEIQQQTLSNTFSKVRGYDENLLTNKAMDYNLTSGGFQNTIINTSGTFKINDLYKEAYDDTRFRSYYANAAYTWQRKYTINASTRFDESNLFGKDVSAQDKPVWAVGGSWLLSNETFMEAVNWIGRLQLRATYGITGNSPAPGSGGSYDILSPAFSFGIPAGAVNALSISSPGNSKLTWEQTQNINIGTDFSLLNHRLTGSIDYYRKHTTNLLGVVPQNSFTGYATVFGNAGIINNSGLELSLSTVNLSKPGLNWSSRLTFSWNKGKVAKLYTERPMVYASSIVKGTSPLFFDPANLGLVEGHQPFSLFAYRYAGLDDKGDPQITQANGSKTKAPGVARVEDLVNMGSTVPLIRGGLSNTFRYKQFSLDANLVYSFDFVLRREVNEFYTDRVTATNYTTGNLHREFLNRWKQAGDELKTNIPAFDPASDRASRTDLNYYTAADINVIKGDYIKMRDISLVYSIPPLALNKLKIRDLSFRIQVNNIMLWTANKDDIDPEFYNGIGARATTYVNGVRQVPFNQGSVTLGAHLGF